MKDENNESSEAHGASTGQLLRRYRKQARLTAQELAREVTSRYPDDNTTPTVIFNIEAERKTAITITELAHFSEVLGISPIQLLCDCEQPYLPAQSGAFQGKTARQVIDEFTLPKEAQADASTSTITTTIGLEDNLQSILNLGAPIYGNVLGELKLAMSSSGNYRTPASGSPTTSLRPSARHGKYCAPSSLTSRLSNINVQTSSGVSRFPLMLSANNHQ